MFDSVSSCVYFREYELVFNAIKQFLIEISNSLFKNKIQKIINSFGKWTFSKFSVAHISLPTP